MKRYENDRAFIKFLNEEPEHIVSYAVMRAAPGLYRGTYKCRPTFEDFSLYKAYDVLTTKKTASDDERIEMVMSMYGEDVDYGDVLVIRLSDGFKCFYLERDDDRISFKTRELDDFIPELISVLVIEPERKPEAWKIPNQLAYMQAMVDGYIEIVYPIDNDGTVMVCNEEGKLSGKPYNRPLFDENGNRYDVIAGTFFVVRCDTDTGDFVSMNEKLIDKYKKLFNTPYSYIRTEHGLMEIAIKV